MSNGDIEDAILKRLYACWFEPNVQQDVNLSDFATELGIGRDHIWDVFYQLQELDLARARYVGPLAAISSRGILHCEEGGLADPGLAAEQRKARDGILAVAATYRESHGVHAMIPYEMLCSDAGIEEESFINNLEVLLDFDLLERVTSATFRITSRGVERVRDSQTRSARLEEFERLRRLDGVTPQQRGHRLEDLLDEVAISENWQAEKRVRAQGTENDLVVHKGLHYFLVSCKWEKDPIEANELELLESRVRSRAMTNGGLLVSMSEFTDNCIEEARFKINSAQILLFGPSDTEAVLACQVTLTELIDNKLEEAMYHRKILVDGVAH